MYKIFDCGRINLRLVALKARSLSKICNIFDAIYLIDILYYKSLTSLHFVSKPIPWPQDVNLTCIRRSEDVILTISDIIQYLTSFCFLRSKCLQRLSYTTHCFYFFAANSAGSKLYRMNDPFGTNTLYYYYYY